MVSGPCSDTGLLSDAEPRPFIAASETAEGLCRAVRGDKLVQVQPMLDSVGDWTAYLAMDFDEAELAAMRCHERTGRPLGTPDFIERLEQHLGRYLHKQKPGPKARK